MGRTRDVSKILTANTSLLSLASASATYAPIAAGGLVQLVPTSVTVGSGTGSADSKGTVSFSGASSIAMDGVFSSIYDNYMMNIKFSAASATDTDILFYLRDATPADVTSGYQTELLTQAHTAIAGVATGNGLIGKTSSIGVGFDAYTVHFYSPFLTVKKTHNSSGHWNVSGGTQYQVRTASLINFTTSCPGIKIYASSGNFSGSIQIYGFRK